MRRKPYTQYNVSITVTGLDDDGEEDNELTIGLQHVSRENITADNLLIAQIVKLLEELSK